MSAVRVLMIDDSEDDAELFTIVFSQANAGFELSYVLDPNQGLARLKREGHGFRLVLLDLNMPERDGKDVLAELRRTPGLQHLPVIVFSSSDSPSDVRESYRLGANACVRKPPDLDSCREFVKRLGEFWLDTASLP